MKKKKTLTSKPQTVNLLKQISSILCPGDVIYFSGDFGVGKTFAASVIIKELTGENFVSSPTFNLVKTYFIKKNLEIWHCDFYRILYPEELEEIGVFENIKKKIILIEWPKFKEIYNIKPLIINLEFGKKTNQRNFNFEFSNEWGQRLNFYD